MAWFWSWRLWSSWRAHTSSSARWRQIDAAGLALIKQFEGCRLTAYQDAAGVWTIGWGNTYDVSPGQTITQAQADAQLAQNVNRFGAFVDSLTSRAPTTDNQFSAMVSLAFNIGDSAFRSSTVLRKHLAGDYAAAADAFLLWDHGHVDGKLVEIDGLLHRRKAEKTLYLTRAV